MPRNQIWLHVFKWLEDSERWKHLNLPQQIINIVTLMNLLNKEPNVVLRFLILLILMYPYLTNILTSWWGWRHWDLSPEDFPQDENCIRNRCRGDGCFFSHSVCTAYGISEALSPFFTHSSPGSLRSSSLSERTCNGSV